MEMRTDPDRSARLQYRAINPSDDVYFKESNTDLVGLYQASPHTATMPTDASVKAMIEMFTTKTLLAVMICLPVPPEAASTSTRTTSDNDKDKEKLKPEVIGSMCLMHGGDQQRHHRCAMIGIRLFKDHRGKGYGSEAINWILDWGFLRIGLHKVEIICYEWNPRARQLYEKLGFVKEGERRESLFLDGRFWNQIELGMLESEWKELRKKRQGALSEKVVV